MPAHANEYAERIRAQETLFPSGPKIEGINAEGGITTSQTYFEGVRPEHAEIEKFMADRGFKKVAGDSIQDERQKDAIYFHSQAFAIADARPANFKKLADGKIVALDLMVAHAEPGSALHKALSEGVK
jgi:hypothetical protein